MFIKAVLLFHLYGLQHVVVWTETMDQPHGVRGAGGGQGLTAGLLADVAGAALHGLKDIMAIDDLQSLGTYFIMQEE